MLGRNQKPTDFIVQTVKTLQHRVLTPGVEGLDCQMVLLPDS
jgi:hypothetical protein